MSWRLSSRSLNLTISQRQKNVRPSISRSQATAFLSSNRIEGDINLRTNFAIYSFISLLAQFKEGVFSLQINKLNTRNERSTTEHVFHTSLSFARKTRQTFPGIKIARQHFIDANLNEENTPINSTIPT
jgi:hypothetical protein